MDGLLAIILAAFGVLALVILACYCAWAAALLLGLGVGFTWGMDHQKDKESTERYRYF